MSEHGTIGRYSNGGCRCRRCRATWRTFYRTKGRAKQRLLEAHRSEYERLVDEELAVLGMERSAKYRSGR